MAECTDSVKEEAVGQNSIRPSAKLYNNDAEEENRVCSPVPSRLDVENNEIELEKYDDFEENNSIPSRRTPEFFGSSDEPEVVESKDVSIANASKKRKMPSKEIQGNITSEKSPSGPRNKKQSTSGMAVCRTPSVNGLTIPFRTIKKAMKLDPDIPIVQNEAAIMTTVAVELFLKRLVVKSNQNAKNRGRNTVRYEDVAEARTSDKALSFLEPLLP